LEINQNNQKTLSVRTLNIPARTANHIRKNSSRMLWCSRHNCIQMLITLFRVHYVA